MTQQTNEKPNYKKTLNLPKTSFAMKANLVQREPQIQKRWAKPDLYERMMAASKDRPRFLLHDGPPYANGAIHLGHLLNKVLKDLVIRSHFMLGYDTPFVPGWDCHGLPIEHKVMTEVVEELGDGAAELSAMDIRKRCAKYAGKFVKLQMKQMQRLGTVADYSDPYLTMKREYEGAVLEVFAALVGRELVFRHLKPVHWSIDNQTALADAELEYHDREDTSVFVIFEVENPDALPAGLGASQSTTPGLMIWTTTPWTLPANLAVAVSPRSEYGLYRFERDGMAGQVIIATALAEQVFDAKDAEYELLGTCSGTELEDAGVQYRHAFLDRVSPVVTAEYVTLEDGTGMVHTAPGHGVDDYQTGQRIGLDIYCPVREDGTFDESAPEWIQGKSVWEANDLVVENLRESGALYDEHKFMHSYPHDWRSKGPVIFRATRQWFIAVDAEDRSLRGMALEVTENDVKFIPEWGRNRMRGMLDTRPDWCISRQRAWGLPIPAFYGEGDEVLLTRASVEAVAAVFREMGSDAWFKLSARELLDKYDVANDPDAPAWVAGALGDESKTLEMARDIFDVWFESGSSWNAVLNERGLEYPADLYLEGSDQHRGWFQLSLLPSLGVNGQSPFKAVLTHGFMVDKDGRKMSKSDGNALNVDELMKDYGADVCRLWVCSLNTDNDIKVDESFFALAGEEYRKIRNTIRFLLSNLGDFDVETDRRELMDADAGSVDAWVVGELNRLIQTVRDAYQSLTYRKVHEAVFHFCNETLSAVYLAAVKDRLYCDKSDSDRRRRTQTVIFDVASALIRLVAPVLVHTADEAWQALHGRNPDKPETDDCVHLHLLPEVNELAVSEGWAEAISLRDRALKVLEDARSQRGLDNPLDAGIECALTTDVYSKVVGVADELADLCGVSRFEIQEGEGELIAVNDLTTEPRCERSWKRDGTVAERSDGGALSQRDAEAVGVE